jgi:hypothetical protein
MNRIRIELAAEVSRLKRSSSVWFAGAWSAFFIFGPTLLDVWHQIPQDLKDALPSGTTRWVGALALVTTLVARLIRVKLEPKDQPQDPAGDPQ